LSIDPKVVLSAVRTAATIKGRHFYGELHKQIDSNKAPTSDRQFTVFIGEPPVEAKEVVFVDTETLTITVPRGLPIGRHDLTVVTPGGRSATLAKALTVISGEYSGERCETDRECIDPCRSVYACIEGQCTKGEVDKDDDGDGLVDIVCQGGSDCDDTNSHCTIDCTDLDSDSFCVAHDCDDSVATGASCHTGCSLFYKDADGDGYGDSKYRLETCVQPEGYVSEPTDCDDTCDVCWTGRAEVCGDGEDNNCNGEQDEENAQGCVDYYMDSDQDGYGHLTDSKCLCAAESVGGYNIVAPDNDDCDDSCDVCWTGRAEVCGDGEDNNCDGEQDEEGSQGCTEYYLDSDQDGHGHLIDSKCLCIAEGAGGYNVVAPDNDDCDDTSDQCTALCNDVDFDLEFDCSDDCVDVDGDGLGNGNLNNDGCVDTTTDSDDTDNMWCADSDSDGCDDCRWGYFDPLNDGLDLDGDGICELVIQGHQDAPALLPGIDEQIVAGINPPVDSQSSILFFNITHDSVRPENGQVTGQLSNDGASVVFERFVATDFVDVEIEWSVVQLDRISVQRGSALLTPGLPVGQATEVNLTQAVEPTRAFTIFSIRMSGDFYSWNDWAKAKLIDTNTLGFYSGTISATSQPAVAEWQVIEFEENSGAFVQHGETAMAIGETSVNVDLSAPAPLDRSFLLCSHLVKEPQFPPKVANHVMRGTMVNESELVFERDRTAVPVELSWSVVTWDAMRVQHGDVLFAEGEGEQRIALSNRANPDASVSFLTGFMREGKSPYAIDDGVGVAWFTSDIQDNGDTVVLRRGSTVDSAEASWSVVEFQ